MSNRDLSGEGFVLLNDCNVGENKIKISGFDGSVLLHEQRVYTNHDFGARKKMLTSFVLPRNRSDEREETWVAKVLLLFRCFVRWHGGSAELAFVQYMECVPPLNGVDEALGCAF